MSADAPKSGGPPGAGGAPQPEESSAERSAFMDEIRQEVHGDRRKRMIKFGGGGAIVAGLFFGVLLYWATRADPKGCFANETRKVAYDAITAGNDSAANAGLSQRFEREDYRCAEIAEPKGTLVAVKEDGDPIVWFVDESGRAFNVNLLSAAWTPRLGTGPSISDEQIAGVVK